jgi:hypothetical protein
MRTKIPKLRLLTPALGLALLGVLASAQAADKKPNILVIMGDDIGWFNVGSYNQGIMLIQICRYSRTFGRTRSSA